jgi:hypothetical protein
VIALQRIVAKLVVLGAVGCAPTGGGGEPANPGNDAGDGGITLDGNGGQGGGLSIPSSCEQAEAEHAYVGCEYWPTVVANEVFPIFDYAVIVANGGLEAADVSVTGPGGVDSEAVVAPGQVAKIFLPWVDALKFWKRSDGVNPESAASVLVAGGAYRLASSRPVSVYQFSPLEYKSVGGPPGKIWGDVDGPGPLNGTCEGGNCLAHSNDASLLLPTSALTGTYRVAGQRGQTKSAYFAITATEDDTHVSVTASALGAIVAGEGIAGTPAGGTLELALDAGDVAQLFSPPGEDPSGALVQASKPVQVIAGESCLAVPTAKTAFCDHVEESVLPAESQGKHYVVARPTGPEGGAVGHVVRLYASFDGTQLTYAPAAPNGAPSTLDAGQVVDLGVVEADFEVSGDQPFAVGVTMLSSTLVSDNEPYPSGDPSQSFAVAVEQYRQSYVFLAADDYDQSFVDVIAPEGTSLSLDGAGVSDASPSALDGRSVHRIPLSGGAHWLEASQPVGIQVMGYGNATSYQYPGGSALARIAPPPVR